jgi:hypothetical protein
MARAKRSKASQDYEISVFVNCPFDSGYKHIFRAIVFAVIHCGFRARCALEIDDGSQVRIEKIFNIIDQCRFGIHDLSRTELDQVNRLPRFNMPLELGLFLGAKRYGRDHHGRKIALIFDREAHRYQKFISDIAGQDIRAHQKDIQRVISSTSDWLRSSSKRAIPGGLLIGQRYRKFKSELPILCKKLQLKPLEITFNDYSNIATDWLTGN